MLLLILLFGLTSIVHNHGRLVNQNVISLCQHAVPPYAFDEGSDKIQLDVMYKRNIQTEPLVHSVSDLNNSHLVLFAYALKSQRIKSCLINGISVPWAKIDYNTFKCEKPKNIHESDALSIQTIGGEVLPSIVQWKDRMTFPLFSNASLSLCIITMVRNEGPRIKDWIEYHIRQGVQSFIIYENNSSDNTAVVIQKYKEVIIIDWPWHKTKREAYMHGILLVRGVCKWALFNDVDEYVFPAENRASHTVKGLLTRFPYWLNNNVKIEDMLNVNQICFETKVMGSSGLIKCPNVTVPEGFIHFDEWWYKAFGKCAIRPHKSLLRNTIHKFKVIGRSYVLPRSSAYLVHYKYQCWEYFITKWDKGRSSRMRDWSRKKLNISKPNRYFTKEQGPIDTLFRDYKRILDRLPLRHGSNEQYKDNNHVK